MSSGGRLKPLRLSTGLAFSLLAVLFAAFFFLNRVSPSAVDLRAGGFVEVRFTRPVADGPRTLRGGPDAALAQAIAQAQISVDMAIYDLDLWSVRDALLRADRRGVPVRLVVEADNLDSPELYDLIAAGIPVAADGYDWLMHDKFTVIDGREVWTGSMNYTVRDGYFNNNNLLRLVSDDVASAYAEEFEEMFVDDTFGSFSPPGDGRSARLSDGTDLEIYFSPDDQPLRRLLELVELGAIADRLPGLRFHLLRPGPGHDCGRAAGGCRARRDRNRSGGQSGKPMGSVRTGGTRCAARRQSRQHAS